MPLSMKQHRQFANRSFWFIAWEFRPAIRVVFFAKALPRSAGRPPVAVTPAEDRAFRFPASPAFREFPAVTAADGRWCHSSTRREIPGAEAAIRILLI